MASFLSECFAEWRETPWHPVSKAALIGWLVFYVLFLIHAATAEVDFRIVDNANFVVHEAGHLLFSYLGEKAGVAGGTIFQFFVPAVLAMYFMSQRHLPGAVFGWFFFFENCLYTAPYIADARRQELPLASVGGGDVEHDWTVMLSWFGMLDHEDGIARLVRVVGWLGMLAVLAWFAWRGRGGSGETRSFAAGA